MQPTSIRPCRPGFVNCREKELIGNQDGSEKGLNLLAENFLHSQEFGRKFASSIRAKMIALYAGDKGESRESIKK